MDGTPADSACKRWQSSTPFPTAAATAAETSFSCGPALTEEAILRAISKVHSRNHVPRSSTDPMTSKFLRLFLAVAVLFAISALAQTSSAATPSSPAAAPALPPLPSPAITGTKVGAINIEGALFGCNEGRRDMRGAAKKLEPKKTELKSSERRPGKPEEATQHPAGQAERGSAGHA